ncbi:MAG: hypothetical protein IPN09_09765 [Bacteroidetes bacterium]|nr:hypothetical protein [Bacteroidota bacterium]
MKQFLIMVFILKLQFNFAQHTYFLEIKDSTFLKSIFKDDVDDFYKSSGSKNLDFLFNDTKIIEFHKPFPTSKTDWLQSIYFLNVSDTNLFLKMCNLHREIFPFNEAVFFIKELCYTPNDFNINPNGVTNKHLDLIRAREAWEITKGDPNIVLGITDTYLKTTLEDISQKINFPILGFNNDNNLDWSYHGSATSGCMVAHTDNNLGICGIGFNCKLKFNSEWAVDNEILLMSQQGYKIINASWFNSYNYSSVINLLYSEIRNNGSLVFFGAGNGKSHSPSGNSLTNYVYPACYDSVMCITSVGYKNDYGTQHLIMETGKIYITIFPMILIQLITIMIKLIYVHLAMMCHVYFMIKIIQQQLIYIKRKTEHLLRHQWWQV